MPSLGLHVFIHVALLSCGAAQQERCRNRDGQEDSTCSESRWESQAQLLQTKKVESAVADILTEDGLRTTDAVSGSSEDAAKRFYGKNSGYALLSDGSADGGYSRSSGSGSGSGYGSSGSGYGYGSSGSGEGYGYGSYGSYGRASYGYGSYGTTGGDRPSGEGYGYALASVGSADGGYSRSSGSGSGSGYGSSGSGYVYGSSGSYGSYGSYGRASYASGSGSGSGEGYGYGSYGSYGRASYGYGKGGGGAPAPAPAPAPSGGGGGKSDCEGGTIPDCPSCGTKYELTKDEMCRHLTIHNKLRACVKPKPPPLSWDCKLMCQIQEYVDKGNSGHSDCYGSPIEAGENMAMWMPLDRRFPYKAEWMWFDSEYSYRGGHYTAMIWSSSKSLGCAINTDKNLVFCQYANAAANFGSTSDPNNAGNFDGNYAACGITEKEKACWSASTASACD